MVALENRERIVSELITHVNELDAKIASLHDVVDEANDLQLVNKLDLINLKNEMERVALTLPALSPEAVEDFQKVTKVLEKLPVEMVKTLASQVEQMHKELERMGERVAGLDSPIPADHNDARLEDLEKRISLASVPRPPQEFPSLKKLEAAVQRLQETDVRKEVADLRDMIRKQQSLIESMQEKYQRNVNTLEEKLTTQEKEKKEKAQLAKPGKTLSIDDVQALLKKHEEDLKKETLQMVMKELQKVMS